MKLENIAFVDIETTGSRVNHDRIIEIGILRIEQNKLVRTYQTLINPETYVSPFIEQMTGIHAMDLTTAPTFEQVKEEILEILDNCIFVAHNVRFDYGFVKNEFRRYGHRFSPQHFCTVKLSRMLFPQYTHHSLDALIQRYNFTCEGRHRAFGDAKILWDFYQKVHTEFSPEQLQKTFDEILKKPSLPAHIPVEVIDNLPEEAGVYIFYGENEVPLYVGKSINIKDRVLSHFTNDHTSSKEMNIAQQIRRIEAITTAGELGALLKEASLVKELQPLYNRRLREMKKLIVAKKVMNDEGYQTIELEEVHEILASDVENILGIYKSKHQAKEYIANLAKEHQLCEKLLGLEKTKGACFGYKIQKCKGACIGKEKTIAYNLRFTMAFMKTKIKTWPFDGTIRIVEKDIAGHTSDGFMIDKWCLVDKEDVTFDLDTYKILVRYLFNPKNSKNIFTSKLSNLSHSQHMY